MSEFAIYMLPLLPLAAFLANGLAGARLGRAGGWIAFGAMAVAALASTVLLIASASGGLELPIRIGPIWEWMAVGDLNISIGLHYDQLTAVMCFVITFVGSLVFLYAIGYMWEDPGFNRFFAYLSLFAFSMLVLVLGDSFPLLFVGWEGVGLCSYLLIGYYMDAPGAADAGKKAFIVNRIGDAGFLLAMFLIFQHLGTLEIARAVELAPSKLAYGGMAATLITMLLFLGCTGKSAQIPLFIWLPDAMAGPTPVSALIHAATMVTAGIYLVVRTSTIFVLAPATMQLVACIGCATAFVAGTIALTQRDIKKVLAYSTVSQLGYMFLACGVGAFSAGIFHVVTHAFFKACLFLGAGAVIHALHGTQDLFLMGGLRRKLPVVWGTFLVACLAISGVPPLAGFFSKDEILWRTLGSGHLVLYLFGLATALMTGVYSLRALILAFEGESRTPGGARHHLHHPHWTMQTALVVLAVGSVVAGFFNVPHAMTHSIGLGEGAAFEHFLAPVLHQAEHIMEEHPIRYAVLHSVPAEIGATLVSIVVVILAFLIAQRFILHGWPDASAALARRFGVAAQFSARRWWWDEASNFIFAGGTRLLARASVAFDRLAIDGILGGIAALARLASRAVRAYQRGQVQGYALGLLIGVNLVVLVVLLWP